MAISVETLLGELASELGELIPGVAVNDNSLSGQITTANSAGTSAVDVNNRFEYDEHAIANSYLRVKSDTSVTTNNNKVVKVTTYNSGTNTMTLTAGLGSLNTTTQYQLFRRLPPSAYLQAIIETLRLAYPSIYDSKSNTSLTVSPTVYVYTVPGDIQDVTKVELQVNTGIASYPYVEIPFEVRRSTDELKHIQLFQEFPATYTLRISGSGFLTAPTSLVGTVDITGDEIEILKMGCKASLYRKLAGLSSDGSDDQGGFFNLANEYYKLFLEAKAKHHKPKPKMTMIRDPRYGWL